MIDLMGKEFIFLQMVIELVGILGERFEGILKNGVKEGKGFF
jgi:hypothetical protein